MGPLAAVLLALFPPSPPQPLDCGVETAVTLAAVDLDAKASSNEADAVAMTCGPHRDCVAEITLRLRNCGRAAVQVRRVESPSQPVSCLLNLEGSPDLEVAAGQARSFWCVALQPGALVLEATVDVGGKEVQLAPIHLEIRPPDDGRARCGVCRGLWGRHGKAPTETCRCASMTAGRKCRDNSDCDGECLLNDTAREPVSGTPVVGQCSEYEGHSFGCYWHVQVGRAVRTCRD